MPLTRTITPYGEAIWELRTDHDETLGRAEALTDGDTILIARITVPRKHRGHGYATHLLNAVLTHFPDSPVEVVASPLTTRHPGLDQAALQAWYTRHGFTPTPRRGDPLLMLRPPKPTPQP
ncbi:GNAT family N-acetyltransferase [Streptomyces luteireticuli]|uniref:GNAT family N-acetyltransferase n=1 Tax=Streptomyces luteireticuli TaxID=173858 RepID=UPI003555CCB0